MAIKKTRRECGEIRHSFDDAKEWAELFKAEGTIKAIQLIYGVDPETVGKWFSKYAEELGVSRPRLDLRKDGKAKCSCCEEYKKENETNFYFFAKDNRFSSACKDCAKARARERHIAKKDEVREAQKKYAKNNSEKIKTYKRKSKEKNKEKNNKKEAERKKSDPLYKLKCNLRSRLSYAFKKGQKKCSAIKNLGCSLEDLKKRLSDRFYPNPLTGEQMTWENYGKWHVDHIFPLFKCQTEEEILKACHYTNLQPLWAYENLAKRAKILDGVKLL